MIGELLQNDETPIAIHTRRPAVDQALLIEPQPKRNPAPFCFQALIIM